jgi:hypothetical protein
MLSTNQIKGTRERRTKFRSALTLCKPKISWRIGLDAQLQLRKPSRGDPQGNPIVIMSSSTMASGDSMSCRLCRYQGSDIRLLGCGCTLHAVSFIFHHRRTTKIEKRNPFCLLVGASSTHWMTHDKWATEQKRGIGGLYIKDISYITPRTCRLSGA